VPALICVIAPEILAITAVRDLVRAREAWKRIERVLKRRTSITHGYFLEMGGFCLKSHNAEYHQLATNNLEQLAASEGFGKSTELVGLDLSETSMNDLGKSDSLTKTLTCVQTLWFVTQVTSRLREHKAITLLEVSTSAYASCAVLAYAAWWKKPQGYSMPILNVCSNDTIDRLQPSEYAKTINTWAEFFWVGRDWAARMTEDGYLTLWPFTTFAIACPILFGAIHVASWNFILPSVYELWTWRASSLFCVVCFPLSFIYSAAGKFSPSKFSESRLGRLHGKTIHLVFLCTVCLYLIIRLYMIVEIFISLRAFPHSAYDSAHG